MLNCLLLLLWICRPLRDRPVAILAAAQGSIGLADSIATERILEGRDERGPYREADLFARPFVDHPALLYAVDVEGSLATAWLAEKMRYSRGFARHVWWLPQTFVIGGNSVGLAITWHSGVER